MDIKKENSTEIGKFELSQFKVYMKRLGINITSINYNDNFYLEEEYFKAILIRTNFEDTEYVRKITDSYFMSKHTWNGLVLVNDITKQTSHKYKEYMLEASQTKNVRCRDDGYKTIGESADPRIR